MQNFNELNLPKNLLKALDAMKFQVPTPIQAQTVPVALDGQDVLGTAQTGTGKTGAFAIPLAAKLIDQPEESVLVLTPTRELATQVIGVFNQLLTEDKSIRTALLIGGESIDHQFRQLKSRPRVIVGTPGRINDHLKRGTLKLKHTNSLVLDETDLMLDMGFDVQIATIIAKMPQEGRHTMMFSATLPKKIEGMAAKYLNNPVRVSVGQQSTPGTNIEQDVLMTTDQDKYTRLLEQLDKREGSIIVFVKTKRGADRLSVKLNDEDHKSGAIHGDLRQNKRDRVLSAFRNKKYRIMVATDVAARGIDIPHIRHVINYDLPQCPEDYIHRIGRTARAGEKGFAVSFVTSKEKGKWFAIERLLDPNAKREAPRREHDASLRKNRDASRQDGKKPFSKNKPGFAGQKFKRNKKRPTRAAA
jgi:superfamily II DNA/RNA helicase